MPTKREREYYQMGFADGSKFASGGGMMGRTYERGRSMTEDERTMTEIMNPSLRPKRKRKLSAWNKYVKANSNKPRFRLRSGSPNLKKLGVAFRKTPAGKKTRR